MKRLTILITNWILFLTLPIWILPMVLYLLLTKPTDRELRMILTGRMKFFERY